MEAQPLTITMSLEDAGTLAAVAAKAPGSCHGSAMDPPRPPCESCQARINELGPLLDTILDSLDVNAPSVTFQITPDQAGAVLAHALTAYLPDPMDAWAASAAAEALVVAIAETGEPS